MRKDLSQLNVAVAISASRWRQPPGTHVPGSRRSASVFRCGTALAHYLALAIAVLFLVMGLLVADLRADEPVRKIREIFVPFDALDVLLEGQPQRVLLSREQYEEMWQKARKRAETRAPLPAAIVAAEYVVAVADERVQFAGTLAVDVLDEGLHALALDLSGVGLRRASLDGKSAAIGRGADGRLTLFVDGKGRHSLTLDMVAPLETTAAQQAIAMRLSRPPAARMSLTVPGDVEIKSGADVASRVVDAAAQVTRFELVPKAGDTTLVMTLNSHLQRRERAVLARSVLVDEVTEAYERIHATVSLAILHRAVDSFRFAVPDGFDVTDVSSPLLSRWAMASEGKRRILEVRLREQTTATTVLSLSALKTSPRAQRWTLPKLEPLDVDGQVAVVGLLIDQRLQAESIDAEGLIAIDTNVLARALPATVLRAEPGAPSLRPVVAYYAPQADFGLSAQFVKPPAQVRVATNVLLVIEDRGPKAQGSFTLTPEFEKLFGFEFTVPAGWQVTAVTAADKKPLSLERYGAAGRPSRVHVRLAQGVSAGQAYRVDFAAAASGGGLLVDRESREIEFPVFAVAGAARDAGAIAIDSREDLVVRPKKLELLTPLGEKEKILYGLAGLAYRYDSQPYRAVLSVERTRPRLTARTFSFLRVEPDALAAHYEIIYQAEEARTQQLTLSLPESTPAALSIRGLDNVRLKEFVSQSAGGVRRWNVLLVEPRRGRVRLAVDFQQPYSAGEAKSKSMPLPIVRAEGVAYQSGMVAVEGSAELDVQVATSARRLDVGELVDAEYQPGRRLLGAYGFAGDPVKVEVTVARHPGYWIDPAIVQKAELATFLSADGVSQTAALFRLRTKSLYLDVHLPEGSQLWSAQIDGKPIKPQKQQETLLMSLPSAAPGRVVSLEMVYETPVNSVGFAGRVELRAPSLVLHSGKGSQPLEVPMADLAWRLYSPPGYQVFRSTGSVVAQLPTPEPAALTLVKAVAGSLLFSPGPIFTWQGCRCGCSVPAPMAKSARPSASAPKSAASTVGDAPNFEGVRVDQFRDDTGFAAARQPTAAKPAEEVAQRRREMKEEARKEAEAKPAEPAKPGAVMKRDGSQRGMFDWHSGTRIAEIRGATAGNAIRDAEFGRAGRRLSGPMLGFSSLKIDLQQAAEQGEPTVFLSLGVEPRLVVTLASGSRLGSLEWGVAMVVLLAGFWRTNRSLSSKTRLVVGVFLVATLLALIPGLEELAGPCNAAVYAAAVLVPYYLLVWPVRRLIAAVARMPLCRRPAAATTGAVLTLACLLPVAMGADGPPSPAAPLPRAGEGSSGRYVVQVVEPPEPVKIPEDAVILPYDPDSKTGVQQAGKMLVPYAKYVELWNLAHPDKKLGVEKPPADYALAGVSYAATLEGEESLTVQGQLAIDVYADGFVAVPFGLAGCVLSRAELDGKPARVSVAAPDGPQPVAQKAGSDSAPSPGRGLVVLHVSGKGRHQLQLAVRLRLDRRGGWRVAEGVLPSAPAALLTLTAPQAKTEVRLAQVVDRRAYETVQANQKIETALGPTGLLRLQWRPKVAEGQVDRGLTAYSKAVFDVQEDGLRAAWQLGLEFPRSQREAFRVRVPDDYLVEKVEGGNVRGWEVRKEKDHQSLEVSLLKPAKDREQCTLRLWRGGAVGRGKLIEFDVPLVLVPDALLHNGDVTIRRSPLLEVRVASASGVTRTDLPTAPGRSGAESGAEDSPLGIRLHQAYHFGAAPFAIRLAATPVLSYVAAEVSTLLKISDYERSLETRVNLEVRDRPLHEAQILLPGDLRVDDVAVPGDFLWALTRRAERPLLTVYLAAGRQGKVPILIRGLLGRRGPVEQVSLPLVEVLNVQRQQGDLAVQVDPVFDVQDKDLKHCEAVPLERLYGWLTPQQRQATRLAIHYARPDYQGTLRLSPRKPIVACGTISNVRVTDRAVEETVLLNFNVQQAGIRGLTFLLPAWMADSRISVPMLREKSVERAGDAADSPVRVRLELQDEVMGELRVLVQNDRLLSARGTDQDVKTRGEPAPIPVVEKAWTERQTVNVRTDRQFVVLENASRDELLVESHPQLEALGRSQKDWQTLRGQLGGNITQAYVVSLGAARPQLSFRTRQRTMAETATARVRFAETRLAMDAHGAYRAQQLYKIDNKTEQFLVIEMPEGARLWTAWVAGEPVKPTQVPGAANASQVRIPLVKTAAGDLDYDVLLQYGGRTEGLGVLGSVNFPLIHVRKLDVELSQVRLYLPDTHRWYDFGGTLRRVEETEMQAGVSTYLGKQVQDLVETARQGSFGGVRALNNLKSLLESPQPGQDAIGKSNLSLPNLRAVQQELKQLEQAPAQPPTYDNRGRLNELFEGQRNLRSRNVTNDLGGNFDREQGPYGQQGAGFGGRDGRVQLGGLGGFNAEWFDKNQIANAMKDQSAEQLRRLTPTSESRAGKPVDKKSPYPGLIPSASRPTVPPNAAAPGQPYGMAQQAAPPRVQADRSEDVLNRYQEKHRQKQQMDMQQQAQVMGVPANAGGGLIGPGMPPGMMPGMSPPGGPVAVTTRPQAGEKAKEPRPADADRRSGQPMPDGSKIDKFEVADTPLDPTELNTQTLTQRGYAGGKAAAAGATPPSATGLASLSVELPLRGTEYLFTTPRGDVEVTARAIQRQTLVRLLQAAAAIVAILVSLGLGRLVWQGRFHWLTSRSGSTLLVALGLLSALLGVALFAGVAALAVGIGIKVRNSLAGQAAEVTSRESAAARV